MVAYLKTSQRRERAREGARELLRGGVAFQDLSLRELAAHLGWPLGTLHRAYSVTSFLLDDLLLLAEQEILTKVYEVGDQGLGAELVAQAHRMYDHMADPVNVQMLRYQMSLGARSVEPHDAELRRPRASSWHVHRGLLMHVADQAGEEYGNLNDLTTLVTAMRDGLAYQFFAHRDRDRWLADSMLVINIAVQAAQRRTVVTPTIVPRDGNGTAGRLSAPHVELAENTG